MSNPLANSQSGKVELTKRSIAIFFSVGALLLVIPVGVVLSENSACRANASACIHSDAYRYLVSAFPYIMIGGGLLIGYNMKRISDSINLHNLEDETEDEESSSSFS
jgi:hypothetical protein